MGYIHQQSMLVPHEQKRLMGQENEMTDSLTFFGSATMKQLPKILSVLVRYGCTGTVKSLM
jgi:hypothetical protein